LNVPLYAGNFWLCSFVLIAKFIPGSPCGSRRVYFNNKSVYTDQYRR
jgi:hypothetical protein